MTVTTPAQSVPAERPADHVTVTVDDVEVTVPKGTLVIRVAELLGTEVPRFCDHPMLDPVAACRACLVEIEGMPKPQPACAMTVSDGMKVRTQVTSPVADAAQKGVMEFLLINHPLDCPVCDKGGECPLQNQAMSVGRPESRFDGDKRQFPKPIPVSDLILLDRERCVSCARCTRFADQVAGDPTLELLERGASQQVGNGPDAPFDSYFSGNTIQICPVGALTSADYRFRARPFDLVSVPTACEHCASGCALRTDYRRGTVTRRLAWDDPEVNEEWNCDKGRFAFAYLERDRIAAPMIREDGELRTASWPEAIDVAARGLAAARGRAGVLVGGRLTLEDAYAYARFTRVALGTDDIDFRARPSSAEEAAFLLSRVAGRPTGPTYADIERAPVVLLAGFEPEDESPIVFVRLRKAHRRRGPAVLSIGSVATRGLRKMGGRLIETVAGGEAAALRAIAAGGDVADSLRQPGAVILVGERLATLPGALSAAAALADATGAALAWIPRRAGERGALDAGALAGLLPGGRPIADPTARAEVAGAWGIDATSLPAAAGRDTAALIEAILADAAAAAEAEGDEAPERAITALVTAGISVADHADPEGLARALDEVPFLVALETRHTEVTDRADVVFPVAVVTEKSGTFVDWEGRARPFPKTMRDALALADARVLSMIADAMDAPIGHGDARSLRAELDSLGTWGGERPPAPSVEAAPAPVAGPGEAVLATWRLLLDLGTMQEGREHLAATRRPTVALMSEATRTGAGISDRVTISGPRGQVVLPVEVADVIDGVVWVPANSPGCAVHADLGAASGDIVRIGGGA